MIKKIAYPAIAVAALTLFAATAFGQGGPMGPGRMEPGQGQGGPMMQGPMGPGPGAMGPGQMMMPGMGQGGMGAQCMMPMMGGGMPGQMGWRGMGMGRSAMGGPWMMGQVMARALGLSGEQYAKIAPLGKQFYRERMLHQVDLRLAKADLVELEAAKDFSMEKITAKIEEIAGIETKFMMTKAKYISQVREQLNEEQIDKLKSILSFGHGGY